MLGAIKRTIGQTAYRMKFRKEIQQVDTDLLYITNEEVKKEIERRNKKK